MSATLDDPFQARADPALPELALALDPAIARHELRRGLPKLSGTDAIARLEHIRVIRHKPGKRCVVEYHLRIKRSEQIERIIIIGKIRARRFGNESLRLLTRLWEAGFDEQSPDGISVPEPLGLIPDFKMWCQRKVSGPTADHLLGGPDGVQLAQKIADAIHKLHQAGVPAERKHTKTDELRILHECLEKVTRLYPRFSERVKRVSDACSEVADRLPASTACNIHRDFYPAQVLVTPGRLYLIDFDLYCAGDAGLDPGNFLAHVTEQSLRQLGSPSALSAPEQALQERFVALSGEQTRVAVRTYSLLSLARHIYLSTQFPERHRLTEPLLELCEQRLGL